MATQSIFSALIFIFQPQMPFSQPQSTFQASNLGCREQVKVVESSGDVEVWGCERPPHHFAPRRGVRQNIYIYAIWYTPFEVCFGRGVRVREAMPKPSLSLSLRGKKSSTLTPKPGTR